MTKVRIATFNLENFDRGPGKGPPLQEQIEEIRPHLERLDADILCLQEVKGEELADGSMALLALRDLVKGTHYEQFSIVSTKGATGTSEDPRNLVILSRFDFVDARQFNQTLVRSPMGDGTTGCPAMARPRPAVGATPILYAKIKVDQDLVHVITVNPKPRPPTVIKDQRSGHGWASARGRAKGAFVSSRKRTEQAFRIRRFIDNLFDRDAFSMIVVGGYFNSRSEEVEMEAFRGKVESTEIGEPIHRVMVPSEQIVNLFHEGLGRKLDYILLSRSMLKYYQGTEICNEASNDESMVGCSGAGYAGSTHMPIVAGFQFP